MTTNQEKVYRYTGCQEFLLKHTRNEIMIHRDRIYNINTKGLAKNTCIPIYLYTNLDLKQIDPVFWYMGYSINMKTNSAESKYFPKKKWKITVSGPPASTDFQKKYLDVFTSRV